MSSACSSSTARISYIRRRDVGSAVPKNRTISRYDSMAIRSATRSSRSMSSSDVPSTYSAWLRTVRIARSKELVMKKYTTEDEISDLVRAFEEATINREDWKHFEHLVVGLFYVANHGADAALVKMRDGIRRLLVKGFGVDVSKEMPYHETITAFWIRELAELDKAAGPIAIERKVAELSENFDKDHPLKFYSRELLFSDEARARFVEPDIQLFD